MKIEIRKIKCKRCGHEWYPRSPDVRKCPHCKSYYWDRKKVQKMRKRDGKAIERRRVVPIDQGTLDMVREYLRWRKQFPYKGDLLFPITRQRVDQIFWKLGRRAGINEIGDPAISQHRKLHPHLLRHSFAIHCIKHGMSIERLQKILGHQSPTTTSVYLQFSVADLHEDYDRVWEDEEK